MEYGFSGADINSMTQARQGLVEGFMQLGKQIQTDITRIATIREMKAFGQEMANLDPTSENFPQQLIGTLAKYPLASQTPLASKGIEVLGSRYRAAQAAKAKTAGFVTTELPGGINVIKGVGAYKTNPKTGEAEFIDTTPNGNRPIGHRTISTSEGVFDYDPATGNIGEKLGDLPPSRSGAGSGALTQQLRQINDTIRAYRTERQKLIDQLPNGAAGLPGLASDDPRLLRIKEIEGAIQKEMGSARDITNQSAPEMRPPPSAPKSNGSNFVPMAMPTDVAAPQMTLNQPGNSVIPDNLPVLPGVVHLPTRQEGMTAKLYRVGQNGKLAISASNPKAAVDQAFADQIITEERRNQLYQEHNLQ